MPMIQTINLTKQYAGAAALSNLNLKIEAGECFGFIGPNGAGKTTTIKILATLLKPTWGEARIDGLSVGTINAREVRKIIGYVPDYFGTYEKMLVKEYLEFFAAAYDIHGKKRQQVVSDVLDLTELSSQYDAEVNTLSRGMQQRLSVARVLLHDPKVLLLDEPASGLDPRARIEMRELLKELHHLGKTILISSHILLELADLCTSIGIIEQGELKLTGSVEQILQQAKVGYVLHLAVEQHREQAVAMLEKLPSVVNAQLGKEPQSIRLSLDRENGDPASIAHKLIISGYRLIHMEEEKVNLETAFMRLTQGLVQ